MLKRVSNCLIFFLWICCVLSEFYFLHYKLKKSNEHCIYFRLFTIVDDQLGEVKNQSFGLFHCIGVMETGVSGNYFFYCV